MYSKYITLKVNFRKFTCDITFKKFDKIEMSAYEENLKKAYDKICKCKFVTEGNTEEDSLQEFVDILNSVLPENEEQEFARQVIYKLRKAGKNPRIQNMNHLDNCFWKDFTRCFVLLAGPAAVLNHFNNMSKINLMSLVDVKWNGQEYGISKKNKPPKMNNLAQPHNKNNTPQNRKNKSRSYDTKQQGKNFDIMQNKKQLKKIVADVVAEMENKSSQKSEKSKKSKKNDEDTEESEKQSSKTSKNKSSSQKDSKKKSSKSYDRSSKNENDDNSEESSEQEKQEKQEENSNKDEKVNDEPNVDEITNKLLSSSSGKRWSDIVAEGTDSNEKKSKSSETEKRSSKKDKKKSSSQKDSKKDKKDDKEKIRKAK